MTVDWGSVPAWAGAVGTVAAVSTALGIVIRDGRVARSDREQRDARQARNVLAQPVLRDGFALTVTNWSDTPVRNVYLEDIKIAWKTETKSEGRPVYREGEWRMDKAFPPPVPAVPILRSKGEHTFHVVLNTGLPIEEGIRAIAAYEITMSLTDIETRRWRSVNGKVTLLG